MSDLTTIDDTAIIPNCFAGPSQWGDDRFQLHLGDPQITGGQTMYFSEHEARRLHTVLTNWLTRPVSHD